MMLAQIGCALVILVVLVNVSEQLFVVKTCLFQPPILKYPRPLTSIEARRNAAALGTLKRSWTSPKKPSVTRLKFLPHIIRFGFCIKPLPGKRDVSDAAVPKQTDAKAEREKRSVCPCRKDYRQLTKKEMKDFHKGLKKLKTGSGIYNQMVEYHNDLQSPAAHFGPAFLPWHREYLYQLEQSIRTMLGKTVRVPFWDSALDQTLPDPRDCVVWTKQFWGPSNGQVNRGKLAKNWTPTPTCAPFTRSASAGGKTLLLTRDKYASHILPSPTFTHLAISSPLEAYHAHKHNYVGGMLSNLRCAPNDPVFFLLHSMIDCIWEEWTKNGHANIYPHDGNVLDPRHRGSAPMDPFPLRNDERMNWPGYTCCAKRPSLIKCDKDEDCNSPQGLLFCHRCQCHCKVQEGGDCSEFLDNACYCKKKHKTPRCLGGNCRCI